MNECIDQLLLLFIISVIRSIHWMEIFFMFVLFIKLCCYGAYEQCHLFFSVNKQSFRLSSGEGWSACSNEAILQSGCSVFTFSCTMDWLPSCRYPRFAQSSYLHGTFFTTSRSLFFDCIFQNFFLWLFDWFVQLIRHMRMGKPQCRFMREKPVLKISMVMCRFKCFGNKLIVSLNAYRFYRVVKQLWYFRRFYN